MRTKRSLDVFFKIINGASIFFKASLYILSRHVSLDIVFSQWDAAEGFMWPPSEPEQAQLKAHNGTHAFGGLCLECRVR